ncbi:MAG: hypothetical protein ACPG05_05360 [Bdellovibrionales bacterium]
MDIIRTRVLRARRMENLKATLFFLSLWIFFVGSIYATVASLCFGVMC